MQATFFTLATILIITSLAIASDEVQFNIIANAVTVSGQHLATGTFPISKTGESLRFTGYSTRGTGLGDPVPMYMLFSYISHPTFELLRFPLLEGQSWTETRSWDAEAQTTIEGYETVEVSSGTFPGCLKHKAVITGAKAESEQQRALVNGTRYLWFAKGIGLVKMRYEHSNGITTEAELTAYDVSDKSDDYLPLKVGNTWTYKWKNDYRDEAVIERCQVVESGKTHEMAEVGALMSLEKATYTVAIVAEEPRVAHVSCVLTPKEGSGEVILLHTNNNGADDLLNGYAYYFRDITASDAEGNKLPIDELGNARWAIKPGDKSPVTLSYKALLNHDERDWGFGPDEAPYAKEDCIFWTGRALFVVGEVGDIELRFDIPDDWHVSTPWRPIENEPHHFSVRDQDDLTESFILLGTHFEHLAKSGEAEILLAIGGSLKESARMMQSTVEGFLKAYADLFDGAPKSRMLLVANPYNTKGGLDGGVFGRSISLLMGYGELEEATTSRWVPFVGHEIFHVWNGQAINFSGQEYWFSEGFTNYYAAVVSARLGLISEKDFLERMEQACKRYLTKQGQLSMRDAGNNKSSQYELVYEGGSLVGAALDLQIRNLTDNQKSLDDVMKQMYREFGVTGKKYTMRDVIRIVNEIAGEDLEEFFIRYVSETERLPLAEYFLHAGLDVQVELGEELPDSDYVIHKMLRINSLTTTGDSLIIRRSQSAGYKDEDNLIAVNGTPVKTVFDLSRVALNWKPGDEVELTLLREGKKTAMRITLGGESEEGLPSAEFLIHQMLKIQSLTHPGDVLIIRDSEGAGYQNEDNLIAMAGTPVRTLDEMRRAAKEWKPGDEVELTLLRDGKEVQMKLKLGGEGEEGLPSQKQVIHEMLRIASLTMTKEGLIIRDSADRGYQDEDNLIAMNGVPVKTFEDMRRAAKDWKVEDPVELTLLRKGEKVTVTVTLGGTPEKYKTHEKHRTTQREVSVTITQRMDITDSQQAILSGILGR
ncbi:PDZ domain-containing protein [Candidatus Poribacteria bacterium]|nr:PDZ domain-containing protein [Candidatus Poribacteria bacterium]